MLELAGENAFKVRAYENGARAILSFPGDLEAAVAAASCSRSRGSAPGSSPTSRRSSRTGSLPYYDELRARFPPGLRECLRIPGLGARKARQLHEALGIDSLEALERACREGRLAAVKGFGPASVERILKGIAIAALERRTSPLPAGPADAPRRSSRRSSGRASPPDRDRREPAPAQGDHPRHRLRRRLREPGALVGGLPRPARAWPTSTAEGPTRTSVRFADGLAADLRVVSQEEFPAALLYFTGSQEHNTRAARAREEDGFEAERVRPLRRASRRPGALPCASEAEIYAALGLAYIEPELREGRGEIEAAERGRSAALLESGTCAA